jgi:hypothetical protein
VVPGSTSLLVTPLATSISAGGNVTVDVQLTAGYLPLYGKLPTGNVTVSLGNQSQAVAWQASGATGSASLEAAATFTQIPAGNLPVAAAYAGDANWLESTASGGMVTVLSGNLTPADLPTFTPPAGAYAAPQMVVLADATPGATIYYTTNGATPTTASLKYTGPIWVAENLTIRALAAAPGTAHSAVATAAYTVPSSSRLLPIATHSQ